MLGGIILIIIIAFGIIILVLKPKDFYQKDLAHLVLTRLNIAMFISAIYLMLCYLYFFETQWSINGNSFQKSLAIIFDMPMFLVYTFMYGGGEASGWVVVFVEWSIISIFLKFLIPPNWVSKLRDWLSQ